MTKEDVLEVLSAREGQFISGGALGKELGISRAAVWKAVETLRQEGFSIESVTNRGYRLTGVKNVFSEAGIRSCLRTGADVNPCFPDIRVYETITSTNTVLKQMAEDGAPQGTVLAAAEQTEGRGRLGRSFYSPKQTGVYFSLLLRPYIRPEEAGTLTVCAAAAVAEAIENITGQPAQIKWVNDILLGEKKVCGILTEGAMDVETGLLKYAVVGIGINIRPPEGGFPEDIKGVAGALGKTDADLRCRLVAGVLYGCQRRLASLMKTGWGTPAPQEQTDAQKTLYEDYKNRLSLLGRAIRVHTWDGSIRNATARDLTKDFALVVEYADGSVEALNAGEVSVWPSL